MMDKTASEAYFQGAHEALQSMKVPAHIKVAAAEYLTKEAQQQLGMALNSPLNRLKGLARSPKTIRGLLAAGGLTAAGLGVKSLLDQREEEEAAAASAAREAELSTLPGYASDLKDRLMSGDLSTAEMAALGVGGAGLLGGAAYGASKLL